MGVGCRVQGSECKGVGARLVVQGAGSQCSGRRIRVTCGPLLGRPAASPSLMQGKGSGFTVQGSGCRVQGSGVRVRVQGSRCKVAGARLVVEGAGFQGSGLGAHGFRWTCGP